jgi:hypothetical protein
MWGGTGCSGKKPLASCFGCAYTASPTTARPDGFAVLGMGDGGFGQYLRGSWKGSPFGQVGFDYRAVGWLVCWIWFWRVGCLMVCRLVCCFAFGGVLALRKKSETAVKKTVDGLVWGV